MPDRVTHSKVLLCRRSSESIFVRCLPWWTFNPARLSQSGLHSRKYGYELSNVCFFFIVWAM